MKYTSFFLTFAAWLLCSAAGHAEIFKEIEGKTVDGRQLYEAHLTLHPAPEPVPALKYKLITDPAYQVDRNANIHYLKAGGFFEEYPARSELDKWEEKAKRLIESRDPKEQAKSAFNWCDAAPEELPLEDVKKMLKILRFQERELAKAEKCRYADFGHDNVFESKDPFGYMLPQIQSMRDLARWQSVRYRVALREGRLDDAIRILRQEYTMAKHLEQDLFLVSNLVGIAISGINDENVLYIIQRPDCPSLYWAMAAIPRNWCDMDRSLSIEKRTMKTYFPYREKICNPDSHFPEEFWREYALDFSQKFLHIFKAYYSWRESPLARNLNDRPLLLSASFVIAAYPKAKRYLIEDIGLDRKKVEAFPPVRVVGMAATFSVDHLLDMDSKLAVLPSDQASKWEETVWTQKANTIKRLGLAGGLAQGLNSSVWMILHRSVTRQQQGFNIIQTLEALRIYAYHHGGKLPESIENLDPPAQKDPFTDKHFSYRLEKDGKAILDAPWPWANHFRYVITMKPVTEDKVRP